jgi:WhiB family redox-sensing transcriptional regulator
MKIFRLVDPDDWVVQSACRGTRGLFFPAADLTETRPQRRAREANAKAICGTCTVQVECLDEALSAEERYGIWGGLTERERRSVRARKLIGSPPDIAGPGRLARLPAVVAQDRPMSFSSLSGDE